MSKHTPGPWRFDKDNLNVYADGMLAQTFGHMHTGEREANARLIAAAPELYEALDRAYSQIILLLNEGHFGRLVEFDAAFIVDALAKAKGEP